jgi:hypothetical protein
MITGTTKLKNQPIGYAPASGEDFPRIAHEGSKEPPHLVQTLIAHQPDGSCRQKYQKTVGKGYTAAEKYQEQEQTPQLDWPAQPHQRHDTDARSQKDVGQSRPVEIAGGNEELFIRR